MTIRFDLADFPSSPPTKWSKALANTVKVRMTLTGVDELSIRGVSTQLVCDLQLNRSDLGTSLILRSEEFLLTAHGSAADLDSISAYNNTERA